MTGWTNVAGLPAGRVSAEAAFCSGESDVASADLLPKYNFQVMRGKHTVVVNMLKTCSTNKAFIQKGVPTIAVCAH